MRLITLLAFFVPALLFAQTKYSSEAKKLYNKGIKEYKDGNIDAALGLFYQCVSVESRYAEAYLNISKILYGKKDMDQALNHAKKAYANNKFEPEIYSQLGKCYYQDQQFDSSAFFIDKGIEMGSSDEFLLIYAGKSFYQLEDYGKAMSYFEKAIALNDKNPVSYNSRGKVYFNQGEYDKASADFSKANELDPKSAAIMTNLANSYLANEKAEEAMEIVTKGMEIAEKDEKVQLLLLMGNYYHRHGELDKANEQFNQAFELDKKNTAVLNNQAALFLDQDNFESALDKCNKALDINPEMMEAYFNRGIANEMLRNVEDACSDWEQAFILGSEKAEEYLNSPTCNE